MNHFERLPWISSHPLYVKKGTFVGELSRIATLSSQFDDFAMACREVADIYIARGYPPMLIASWLRNNYQARWDARHRENSPRTADVLVLKSEYNISWDFFNVRHLEEQIKTGWMDAMRYLSFGASPDDMHPLVANRRAKLSSMRFGADSVGNEASYLPISPSWVGNGLRGQYLRLDRLGLLEKRFIVSKKRTVQLIDLTAIWWKSVLDRRDRHVFQTTLDQWITRE